MRHIIQFVLIRIHVLGLAIGTIIYGFTLLRYPKILSNYNVYDLIDSMFDDSSIIAWVFIAFGFIYLVSVLWNFAFIKRASIIMVTFIWAFVGVSFILSEPPNTIGILSFAMAVWGIGNAVEED